MVDRVLSIVGATGDFATIAADVAKCVRDAVGDAVARQASNGLQRVFPEGTPGRRGKLFTLTIPDDVPETKLSEIIDRLKQTESVDSVTAPKPRKPA